MQKKNPKIISLTEAVGMIQDGDMLTFSGFTIWRRPMAFIYELVRQRRKDLHLVEVNGGTHTDILAGAGAIKIWESCWAGHELYGKLAGNVSRKAQAGELLVEDYSHVHMVCRLAAGAMGLPYMPTYASMGTDILNPEYDVLGKAGLRDGSHAKIPRQKYRMAQSDFYGPTELIHIPAARPDWCIAHVQYVGEEGTIRVMGQKYSDEEAFKAADKVIVLAESVVPEAMLRQEPERNLIPPYMVDYIVELPWGAHPTGVYGNYEVDGNFIRDFYSRTRTQEGFDAWAEEWIFGVKDHVGYLEKLGIDRLETLRANPGLKYSTKVVRGKR
ncbi:acyl CoA--acetate/3-ketoacid CoA transferase subunit alpha [Heliobacillus mobilis]|uniref:Acyl CoA--acetate/3-ketoacid CoA transferase subunit alpha n=1 Tax=Heliobacterium mobile TaxID=28064 RepID=A0A6I3SNY4_HELMO|nr:CoA transferase [Heliobacterium mobile]MTV50744.1 acyl CoA--acetate/3-ketoacid CoA transferase subunit alpha [Heliobacterium mobile]